jgi:hypothetical protein
VLSSRHPGLREDRTINLLPSWPRATCYQLLPSLGRPHLDEMGQGDGRSDRGEEGKRVRNSSCGPQASGSAAGKRSEKRGSREDGRPDISVRQKTGGFPADVLPSQTSNLTPQTLFDAAFGWVRHSCRAALVAGQATCASTCPPHGFGRREPLRRRSGMPVLPKPWLPAPCYFFSSRSFASSANWSG